MTVIAVAGGTGTAGRAVVAEAVARGYTVKSLSRHVPAAESRVRVAGASYVSVDFASGGGVASALQGVDALIETLDARSGAALKALPVTSVGVLAAAERAGVPKRVLLSIVNADQCSMGYYQAQASRARSYEAAGDGASVVYVTQFHNLVAGIFSAGARVGLIPVASGVSFQPISTSDVAKELVAQAVGGAGAAAASVIAGGPSVWTMRQLAEQWKSGTGSRALLMPIPFPGAFGNFLRARLNLVPEHAVGKVEFTDLLAENR